jgi:hypothetical protein
VGGPLRPFGRHLHVKRAPTLETLTSQPFLRARTNLATNCELEFLCGSQPTHGNQEGTHAHFSGDRPARLSALVLLFPLLTLESKQNVANEPVRSRAMLDKTKNDLLENSEFFSSCERRPAVDEYPASRPVDNPRGWAPFFTSALLFVGGVSFYDGYLVVRTGDMIQDFEKNPVGLYLIKIDNGNPSVFLRVKAAGTILVLVGLSLLHRRSKRLASPIAFALFAFQTGLLIFLEGGPFL